MQSSAEVRIYSHIHLLEAQSNTGRSGDYIKSTKQSRSIPDAQVNPIFAVFHLRRSAWAHRSRNHDEKNLFPLQNVLKVRKGTPGTASGSWSISTANRSSQKFTNLFWSRSYGWSLVGNHWMWTHSTPDVKRNACPLQCRGNHPAQSCNFRSCGVEAIAVWSRGEIFAKGERFTFFKDRC